MVFNKKNRMLTIQINDEKINNEICRLVFHVEKNILALKKILDEGAPGDRNQEIEDLYNTFIRIHSDIDTLGRDMRSIVNTELQKKDYIYLDDKSFLNDKMMQLEKIRHNLNSIISIIENRPTDTELRKELLHTIIVDVNNIIIALNSIVTDDKTLDKIYKGLSKAV